MSSSTRAATVAIVVAALSFVGAFVGAHAQTTRVPPSPKLGTSTSATTSTTKRAASDDPRVEQQKQAQERAKLTERLAALKKEIAAGERSRAGTASALARAERELASVSKRLDQLTERQRTVRSQIADLDRQRGANERDVDGLRRDLASTLVAMDRNGDRDPLARAMTGRDPSEPIRMDVYLDAIARAQADRIGALQGDLASLESQRKRADDEGKALASAEEAEARARDALAADRLAQRDALSRLTQRIDAQKRSAASLENDERRLTRVVEELQRVIDRRAAEERARREAARQRAEDEAARAARKRDSAKRESGKQREPGPRDTAPAGPSSPRKADEPARPAREPDVEPPVAMISDFARRRGTLRTPVRGAVVATFGAARGTGGGTWKGLFIRSDAGAEVRAVAAGRVVFADHLRGFGNLVIVDHGDQYLSIYGNNDVLRKQTGDAVTAGDLLALAGNSSGDDQTGLYFELRFRGRPIDPAPWLAGR